MDVEKVSLAMCAKHIEIESKQGMIKGNPIDLYKQYGFQKFCFALDYYMKLGKVKTKNS